MAAKKARAAKAPGWEHYFPIPKGHAFDVALVRPPLPVRGKGTVLKRTATALHVRLEVPGGFLIPSIAAELVLTCSADGAGSAGHLEVQLGTRKEAFDDQDITVHSQPLKRTREIAPSLAHRGRSAKAVLHAVSDTECRLTAQGFELKLTLRRP